MILENEIMKKLDFLVSGFTRLDQERLATLDWLRRNDKRIDGHDEDIRVLNFKMGIA